MSRMLRNVVGVKPDAKSDDLKRLVSTDFKSTDNIPLRFIPTVARANYSRSEPSHPFDC